MNARSLRSPAFFTLTQTGLLAVIPGWGLNPMNARSLRSLSFLFPLASESKLSALRKIKMPPPLAGGIHWMGGGGGIRTLDTVARITVFETVPFDHSGTSP